MITIPTFQQLYAANVADLEAEFGVSLPLIGKNALRIFAAVQAGKQKLQYLYIGKVQKNIFVDTADPENTGGTLERFGRVKLGRNPYAATSAQYTVTVTGTIGAIIKASTTFKSNDDSLNPGFLFILDEAFTLTATSESILLRALTPGVDSKLDIGNTLTATSPIALVDSIATVTAETVQPIAAETTEEYRAAALNAYRLEAQGGAGSDYRLWALDAEGVAIVYPYAKSGESGTINLYVESKIVNSIDGKGTPSAAMLLAVEDVIEFNPDTTLPESERGRRPLGTFEIFYLPVTVKEIYITINGYVGLTASIETLLLTAITTLIDSIRPFIASADVLENKNDILDKNRVISAILAQKPGAVFTSVTIEVDAVSVDTYTFIDGNIPYLNSVTHV